MYESVQIQQNIKAIIDICKCPWYQYDMSYEETKQELML